MMEKSQEKDGQIKVLKTRIKELNNETKSNIEEFINIAKQIQEITSRTKIDPNTRKKMKTGEIGRDGIKIENKTANGSKNQNNVYKNILYKNNNNKNGVKK